MRKALALAALASLAACHGAHHVRGAPFISLSGAAPTPVVRVHRFDRGPWGRPGRFAYRVHGETEAPLRLEGQAGAARGLGASPLPPVTHLFRELPAEGNANLRHTGAADREAAQEARPAERGGRGGARRLGRNPGSSRER